MILARLIGAALLLVGFSAGAEAACTIPRPIDQPRTGAPNLSTYTNDYTVITGGCIDGTPIGANTPSTGSFTNINGVSFSAQSYGSCVWDGATTHDVAICINLALSMAQVAGGGQVSVPPGSYYEATTINVPGNVCLVGAGSGVAGSGSATPTFTGAGTNLKWNGVTGGRMAASISTTGQVIEPCIKGIAFNGNGGLAADGLHAASVFRFHFDDLAFVGGFSGGTIFYIGSDGANGGSSQNGTFDNLYIDNGGGHGYTSDQLVLDAFIDGTGVHGNASFNSAKNVFIGGDGATTGIKCRGCDNNTITGRVFNAGTSIDLTIAQSGAHLNAANGNKFPHIQFTGQLYARGTTSFATCTQYSTCTYNNPVNFDQTNGVTPAQITQEPLADLHYSSNSGYAYGSSFIGKNTVTPAFFAAHDYSIWGACEAAALANASSGVAYLCNSTGAQYLVFDSLAGDRFDIDNVGSGGSKNLRFRRRAGSGIWEFVDKVQFDGDIAVTGTFGLAASVQSSATNPGSTTSTASFVMAGLAQAFTPLKTGKVLIVASGNMNNNTASDGMKAQLVVGTGTAPTNGAAVPGGATGSPTVAWAVNSAGGSAQKPFSITWIATLTPNTAYWVDLSQEAYLGGTANFNSVSLSATELMN